MLLLFVSRKFSPKCSEDGFLESRDFSATGGEKSEFLEKMNICENFSISYSDSASYGEHLKEKFKPITQSFNLRTGFQFLKTSVFLNLK